MSVTFTAIVAVDGLNNIGRKGDLLFKDKQDMALFREFTMGKLVIMGRKTWESLPGDRTLPGRDILIVSRSAPRPFAFRSLHWLQIKNDLISEVLNWVDRNRTRLGFSEAVVAGGAELYGQLAPVISKFHVSAFPDVVEDADTRLTDDTLRYFTLESSLSGELVKRRFDLNIYRNTACIVPFPVRFKPGVMTVLLKNTPFTVIPFHALDSVKLTRSAPGTFVVVAETRSGVKIEVYSGSESGASSVIERISHWVAEHYSGVSDMNEPIDFQTMNIVLEK